MGQCWRNRIMTTTGVGIKDINLIVTQSEQTELLYHGKYQRLKSYFGNDTYDSIRYMGWWDTQNNTFPRFDTFQRAAAKIGYRVTHFPLTMASASKIVIVHKNEISLLVCIFNATKLNTKTELNLCNQFKFHSFSNYVDTSVDYQKSYKRRPWWYWLNGTVVDEKSTVHQLIINLETYVRHQAIILTSSYLWHQMWLYISIIFLCKTYLNMPLWIFQHEWYR